MPNLKREFINGEIYHLYNRGVEKREVFLNDDDYYRFIFCLYECNDANFVRMSVRVADRRQRNFAGSHLASMQGATRNNLKSERKLLVELMAFVLMPNHYHLVARPLAEGGMSLFMKKLSNSYTGYFNDKHERRGMGALFQGRFKALRIGENSQLLHLAEYIFSNPVSIFDPNWKTIGIKDYAAAVNFLQSYKWSSYLDSIGINNFPSITNRDFLYKVFSDYNNEKEGMQNIKLFTEKWIQSKQS